MKRLLFSFALLSGLLTLGESAPQMDPSDKRFLDYRPPGPGDSRSPCPALNSIANHGFLPRSGRNVNLVQIVLGLFLGLGVSPEVSALVGAIGLASSSDILTLTFDLEDLRRHLFLIEHDCSFSREDARIGNNNVFNRTLWDVALRVIEGNGNGDNIVTAFQMGRAKSARIRDELTRNPKTVYGPRAAAFGAIEVGLVLSAMGSPIPGLAKLKYVKSIFEEEKIPYDLGWRPIPLATNTITTLAQGVVALAADPNILDDAARVVLGSPADILGGLVLPGSDPLGGVNQILDALGFDNSLANGLSSLLSQVTR